MYKPDKVDLAIFVTLTLAFIMAFAIAFSPMPANPGECRTDSECAAIMGGNGDPVPA